ncbi:PLC-like phosphodiesterase [Trametes versicolor FP-101664 SS1]|uniref:PLC-like phosphodiesterase n=1 Tax=Trametes versicolor (strain FP-101664) TaxID=717944 RepID=UPI000462305B|nr:PLC-like phosphodiesterase [Trametes versicolor FP-101664 SS1]EIW61594.1 PLC-like phosphodiesterase [Trametes versicolor FP-101664 SS1]
MSAYAATKPMPECWGHRGASATFPENTLASFEAAMRDGAEGIESDVHVSVDDVVVMFHDPSVDRVTDGTGLIRERLWHGEGGLQQLRTVKEPKQALATFEDTIKLLMRPENRHVKFNVDVKVQNKPAHLFTLMHKIISAQPDWETTLAPRILLGLWHPSFLPHAKAQLPYCRRSYIGSDIAVARKFFWDSCDVFSIKFSTLGMADGAKFRKDCKQAGKRVMAWTVNEPEHMVEAVRWGIDVIITDTTKTWLDLRSALEVDYDKIAAQHSRLFYWTKLEFYTPIQIITRRRDHSYLEGYAGPFRKIEAAEALPRMSTAEA